MREIKFRAWNKQSKKMVYYDKDCSAPDITLNGVALHHSTSANLSYMYELMQYTGFKDKNGKEIYERANLYNKTLDAILIVYWEKGSGQWYVRDSDEITIDPLWRWASVSEIKC